MKRPKALFAICILLVAVGGLALRLPRLDKRPMHCDEANQAVKAGLLRETGVYRYDPQDHHGPSLYWLTLPSLWLTAAPDLARSSEIHYRIVPVVFGTGLVLLLLLVGDGLGRPAAVLAGTLTALSPAMVFYSRCYIQETLLVFFTFAAIACGWRYVRSRSLGWAIPAGVFIGLMHATKETWVLAAAAMAVGLALSIGWTRWRDGAAPTLRADFRLEPILAAVLAACLVAVVFYSSFGTNWRGPADSILAYATYLRRGGEVPTVPLKVVAAALLIIGAVHLGRQCYALNFRFDADRRNPYVYAHTSTDVLNLAAQVERLAKLSAEGHEMVIHVVTPENCWPLPWYLRRFNRDHVGYWQDPATWQHDTGQHPPPSIIILTPNIQAGVDAHLRTAYNKQMIYGLRPSVLLNVYVREDLWQAFTNAVSTSG